MPSESTFNKSTIIFFCVLQLFAVKILLERLQDVGLIEVPGWVPFLAARTNCGHVDEYEYVIVSRSVVTPDGVIPAAGARSMVSQIAPQHLNPKETS